MTGEDVCPTAYGPFTELHCPPPSPSPTARVCPNQDLSAGSRPTHRGLWKAPTSFWAPHQVCLLPTPPPPQHWEWESKGCRGLVFQASYRYIWPKPSLQDWVQEQGYFHIRPTGVALGRQNCVWQGVLGVGEFPGNPGDPPSSLVHSARCRHTWLLALASEQGQLPGWAAAHSGVPKIRGSSRCTDSKQE